MKKIVLMLAFLLIIPAAAMAAGSVTVSQDSISADGSVLVIKLACVGDAINGSVPATAITAASVAGGMLYDYHKMGFYFYEIWTVAGTVTAPDAADITVNDAKGAEMFDQDNVIAAAGTTEGTVDKYRAVTSLLTVTTANQATADATWDVYIVLVKPFPGGNP